MTAPQMTTPLREIFLKPVDRPIDGVIKADDEASLRIELEEYVLTGELIQRLEKFLDDYNNYSTANGVWISGFFGSGKSHLLKMLALLLENREVDGQRAFDIFQDKLTENPMLAGAFRKAISIPSRSILFNIDQKADVISKTDVDALLGVFQKVFNEMCGYYGKQPHIAQFERDLDERGLLSAFREAFEAASGKPWERGREQALLEGRHIASAFAAVTGEPADLSKDILKRYRADTSISIEDFATMVKAWIDKQEPGFRLNFFIDEVGQYIADNVKLMTNLQTIAESLNTKCRGQAWIIVTAQQAITDVIGDMTRQQEHDFSKIQARFAIRMPLNSADVAEVIQRRLLAKTEEAEIRLGHLYDREENNLKTLFDFADGSFRFRTFSDRKHFIASYPFPAYQYDLFQRAITGLSQHNAFEGKHSSVGERSMLGVFQEVAKKLADHRLGELATFDLMFDGIRTALKSSVQQSIQMAERHLGDDFAMRVLKALFLVKYVTEFKATARNIGILLLPALDCDQTELRRKIEEALSLLERNTRIQRNGDVYDFLTDEEKDVEAEIKALEVDPAEITKELETLFFDAVLKLRRLKHQATGHDYLVSRKVDGHLQGREHELSINLITPFNDEVGSPEAVRLQNMNREELAVLLQPDKRFVDDLLLFRKTDKFVRQAHGGSQQPGRDRILAEKREQNRRREQDLELRLRKHLADARFFVRGDEVEISGEEAQERVLKAFQALVDKVYVNLPMLQGVTYAEADIPLAATLDSKLFGSGDGGGITEAEQELLNHVQSQASNGLKASAKYLVEHFGRRPYGWPEVATLCLLAGLAAKGRLEVRSDGALLEGETLAKALSNSRTLANLLLTPQAEFTPAQLRKAKDFYSDLFGKPAEGNDARSLGAQWASAVQELLVELTDLTAQAREYPFLAELKPFKAQIEAMRDKPAGWYVTEPVQQEDALLDAKEDLLDKVRSFMAGSQRQIYDEARAFLREQEANLHYADTHLVGRVRESLEDSGCYKGDTLKNLRTDLSRVKEELELKLHEQRCEAQDLIDDIKARLTALPEFQSLAEEAQQTLLQRIEEQAVRIERTTLIPVLRDQMRELRDRLLPELLTEIERLRPPLPNESAPQPASPADGMNDPPAPEPVAPALINLRQVRVNFSSLYLSDESDVNAYVETLRGRLLAEVRAGKKVIV